MRIDSYDISSAYDDLSGRKQVRIIPKIKASISTLQDLCVWHVAGSNVRPQSSTSSSSAGYNQHTHSHGSTVGRQSREMGSSRSQLTSPLGRHETHYGRSRLAPQSIEHFMLHTRPCTTSRSFWATVPKMWNNLLLFVF